MSLLIVSYNSDDETRMKIMAQRGDGGRGSLISNGLDQVRKNVGLG
jgi:hypothetical protein